jgi:proton-translocating NADH-quinone oxidoreductase chain L
MLILIVLLPLIGFLSGAFFGRYLGRTVCYTTTGGVFLSLLFSFSLFYEILALGVSYKVTAVSWIVVDTLKIDWSFCFDSLTSVMLIVVTSISTLVHLYSTEYMEHDPHLPRFMSYLSLFTFFMLILITANNFLQMFVGWEGVGLSSYLLINFWFTRIQANKAAIKAMLVNRIGDFALLLAIFAIYFVFNSLDYDVIFGLVPLMLESKIVFGALEFGSIDTICILLFIGAMGKSAQLGLHTWLPDAMEGPTPVSALIHAATMVTAGVFLIVRCSFLFEYSPLTLSLVTFIGSGTAFFAATTGLFQNDMKRVIAYSTCSQLGYMIFACGLSGYEVGVFHLSNHAFFKALLFLGAGSVIHAVADEQDMRKMGGLKNLLPFSYSIMVVGSLALMGFPFLAGFYSKDTILEIAYAKYTTWGHFAYYLGTLAAFFTAFYSVRLLFLVFLSEPNGNRVVTLNAHEASYRMGFPLLILSLLSITVGFMTRDFFVGFGTNFWGSAIFTLPENYIMSDIEFVGLFFKLLPLLMSLIGAGLAFYMYAFGLPFFYNIKKTKSFNVIYHFLNRKWYFDRLYNEFIGQKTLGVSYNYTYKDVDRGLIEKLGPSGIVNIVTYTFNFLKKLQSGFMFHYLFMFLISIAFLGLILISFSIVPIPLNLLIFLIGFTVFEE